LAEKTQLEPLTLEDRRIIFRNFSGKEGKYNAAGVRNFAVVLTEEEGKLMEADGWNVKWGKPREDEEPLPPFLKVNVKYGGKGAPPGIVLITSRGKTRLGEDEAQLVDWADIIKVDLIIRPWQYEIGDRTGVSAYLKSIYVTIREDELELKYSDMPDTDSAASVITQNAEPLEPDGSPY
jgi:hypothetical protein